MELRRHFNKEEGAKVGRLKRKKGKQGVIGNKREEMENVGNGDSNKLECGKVSQLTTQLSTNFGFIVHSNDRCLYQEKVHPIYGSHWNLESSLISLKAIYVTTMNGYIDKGYTELVLRREQNKCGENLWYLPHHGVLKHKDATQLRLVFDCAATCWGTSLNEQLNTGSDLLNNLCGVLLRFRQYSCTMVADIEAMFHQLEAP